MTERLKDEQSEQSNAPKDERVIQSFTDGAPLLEEAVEDGMPNKNQLPTLDPTNKDYWKK